MGLIPLLPTAGTTNNKVVDSVAPSFKDHAHIWEHVAKLILHWIQDQKVWGLISTAGHV